MSELIYTGSGICGIDEAGRGPLAGPVCAAAVVLHDDIIIDGLDDSKKLSEKKRDELFDVIIELAESFSICFATVEEIEKLNILNATFLAMKRCVSELEHVPEKILVDGNRNPGFTTPCECVVKGDSKYASIAAASVLAKVTRDRYMYSMAEIYPEYGFDRHKGYGTAAHYEAIRRFGPSPIHRPSFLRKMH